MYHNSFRWHQQAGSGLPPQNELTSNVRATLFVFDRYSNLARAFYESCRPVTDWVVFYLFSSDSSVFSVLGIFASDDI